MKPARLRSGRTCEISPVLAPPATASGSYVSTVRAKLSSLESVDSYFFLLRLLTIVGLALYYFFTAKEYSAYQVFAWFFPLYVFYSVLLYAGILYWPHAIRRFYFVSLVVDLALISLLILFVGLFVGSFYKFSRLKAGDAYVGSEPIELRALLWEIMEKVRRRAGNGHVNLKLDYPSHPVVAQLDRTLVYQVVSNLVSNALKFTEKGFVQVSLLNGHSSDAVRIVVEDTGVGIRTDELGTIFDEFRQGDDAVVQCKNGPGLGLAIVEESIKSLSGTIQVESVYGKGSKFTVTLPKELRQ